MTAVRSNFLRTVIGLDAAACGLMGAGFAFDSSLLAGPLGLSPAFMQPVGLFLVAYAAALVFMALRPSLPRAAVWSLVAFNAVWAIESFAIMALGWVQPTTLGQAGRVPGVSPSDLQNLVMEVRRRNAAACST